MLLSASCLLAWGPTHPVVGLVVRVVLVDACNLDAMLILGGCRGSEQRRFCGAHLHDLIVVRGWLLDVLFGPNCPHLEHIMSIRDTLEDHEAELESRLTSVLILHLMWRIHHDAH